MESKSTPLILILFLLYACNGQNTTNLSTVNPPDDSQFSSKLYFPQFSEMATGIIYFSEDNGVTWKDRSKGLFEESSIALGGISVSSGQLGLATGEHGVYLFDFQDSTWVNIPTSRTILENNVGPLVIHEDGIYVGTQNGGVFFTPDKGKSWLELNTGLGNGTIRKLVVIDDILYAGTNGGLYSYDQFNKQWNWEYGNSRLQVNGITEIDGRVYIGTNQGAFTQVQGNSDWKQMLPNYTLHNIGADDRTIYAMTYNELLSSSDGGETWKNIQKGLPKELYTFNVVINLNTTFAGQWDGVYKKDSSEEVWTHSGTGLPEGFSAINLSSYRGILILNTSERHLKKGVTLEK